MKTPEVIAKQIVEGWETQNQPGVYTYQTDDLEKRIADAIALLNPAIATGGFKTQLFDRETGQPAGEIEVPEIMGRAAAMVESWMRQTQCSRFGGLMLFSNRKYTDEG